MPRSRKKKRTSSTAKKKSDEEDVDRGQARGEEKAESNSDGETPMEDPVEAEEGEKKDRRDNGDQDEQGGGVGGQHGPSEGLHGEQGGETVGQKEEGNEKQKTGENADQGGQQHGGGMDELMEFNSDDFLDVDLGLGLDAYHDSFPLVIIISFICMRVSSDLIRRRMARGKRSGQGSGRRRRRLRRVKKVNVKVQFIFSKIAMVTVHLKKNESAKTTLRAMAILSAL